MIRKIVILVSILLFLAALDVVSTVLVLGKGGYEANPFAVYQWETIGFFNSVILKMGWILCLGFVLIFMYWYVQKHDLENLKKYSTLINGLLYFLLIYNTIVVANNFYWYLVIP